MSSTIIHINLIKTKGLNNKKKIRRYDDQNKMSYDITPTDVRQLTKKINTANDRRI